MAKHVSKRLFEEVDKFDAVEKGMASASVHGVLMSVLLVRKGRKLLRLSREIE